MTTSRIQLALNVTDIEAATRFYRDLFGVEPAKQRPGYANFAIADPPLQEREKAAMVADEGARNRVVDGEHGIFGVVVHRCRHRLVSRVHDSRKPDSGY